MNCPICGGELKMDEHFEEMRLDPDNIEGMGSPLARVVFEEPADSYDFLIHLYRCTEKHSWYLAENGEYPVEDL